MQLRLTDDKRHYALHTARGTITLTMKEMDELAAMLQQMTHQLRQPSSGGAKALITTRISNAIVSIDMHHTEVILQLQDRGFDQAYAIPKDIAETIRDGIDYQLEAIREGKSNRAKH